MKVILLEDIKGGGKKDEVINSSDGDARNYLFLKKLAVEASKENMAKLQAKQESRQFRKDQEKEEAMKIASKLKEITVTIKVKAGENGKIFGGVTAKEIAENLNKEHKIVVDKKKIMLKETIKTLGVYPVEIKLYEGVIGNVKVKIVEE